MYQSNYNPYMNIPKNLNTGNDERSWFSPGLLNGGFAEAALTPKYYAPALSPIPYPMPYPSP